jgi:2-polyprenyl-6-methoxyphenol hydroxylase-like FAD-dependent oxidoreductase
MVLNALGVGERALGYGEVIHRMQGYEAASKRKVLNVTYDGGKHRRFGLAMHRASLFDCVYHAAQTAGATLISATAISGTTLTNNARFLQAGDTSLGPFDQVIDATGVDSVLSPLRATTLPYGALWGVVDTPKSAVTPHTLAQIYRKASTMVGILPVGTLPGNATHKTALFWSLPHDGYDQWRANPFEHWQAQAALLWPAFAPYAAQLQSRDALTMARYSHGTLRTPIADRLVFIGDAAHRTSPQLGQGANMALLDAMALADNLRHQPIDAALQSYALARRWHVRTYQLMSQVFTPFYQSDSTVLRVTREFW